MSEAIKAAAAALGSAIALAALPLAAHAAEVAEASATPDSQLVVRDAGTGDLRPATADEAATLKPKAALRVAPSRLVPHDHPKGARGVRLNESFMSYSIVSKQADGRLAEACVEGRDAADAVVKAGLPVAAKSNNSLPTE